MTRRGLSRVERFRSERITNCGLDSKVDSVFGVGLDCYCLKLESHSVVLYYSMEKSASRVLRLRFTTEKYGALYQKRNGVARSTAHSAVIREPQSPAVDKS